MLRKLLVFAAAVLVMLAAGSWWKMYRAPYSHESRFPQSAEKMLDSFTARAEPTRDDYLALAGYFIEGFATYATPRFALARYPGLPSNASTVEQNMEGFARIAPLLAVMLQNLPEGEMTLPSGRKFDPAQALRSGVLAGTDPQSDEYWGKLHDYDQRLVEAADVALALWIARAQTWEKFDAAQRQRVSEWLAQVNSSQVRDNNWHLFVVQVNLVLQALGAPYDEASLRRHLDRTRDFYRADGWFRDGVDGQVDFYNAWGFYYHLGWIGRIDRTRVPDLLGEGLPKFADDLRYLIGPRGLPVMGRSICYRLAISAPLVFADAAAASTLPPGQARRALDVTWQYFLLRGAARAGRITQGYCGDDPRLLDDYSGAGSCQWSLRSLIAALSLPADARFWKEPARPLPVETGDFDRPIAGGLMRIKGVQQNGALALYTQDPLPEYETALRPYSLSSRLKGALRGSVERPSNDEAKYRRATYINQPPFCDCLQ